MPAGTPAVAVDSVLPGDGPYDISRYLAEQEVILGDGLRYRVTRDYGVVRGVRQLLAHYPVKNVVHGIAHITGGGLFENLERILPPNARVVIRRGSWPIPMSFRWLQRLGEIEDAEMERVFNMGIGLALVVSSYYAESVRQQLAANGLES